MPTTITPTAPAEPRTEGRAAPLALAVADASWFTTENLFREVRRPAVSTLLLKCEDYVNAWRRGRRPWNWQPRLRQRGPNLWQEDLVLPSGWMKRFPTVGMRPIARSVETWRDAEAAGAPLALVMTYPHYLHLRDLLRPERTVYYNMDDYTLYWPRDARRVAALERQAVRESDLTVCVSKLRADTLRSLVPEAADRIRHLPHGAPTASLPVHPSPLPASPPSDLAGLPRPLLGYVGSLEERVDWALLDSLAAAFPRASLVLVGRPPRPGSAPWQQTMARCLARPNVHAVGWRPQEEIARYNQAFDVCLIPYDVDHPFNRACSPTKIMDSMATGRPVVATALPECRLYDALFDVAEGHVAFLDAVAGVLDAGSDDGRARLRHDWAVAHSCRNVADRLLDALPA